MSDFEYVRAADVKDAAAKLKRAGDGAFLAGGMTLLPAIKLGLNQPSDLIDLGGISALHEVHMDGDNLVIGAMTRHNEVANSDDVNGHIPALADLAESIGDPQVRNRGTIGGSIANNDPAADYPAACLGLGATIITDAREIAADDFFTGFMETALKAGEIITAVKFPVPSKAAYAKFAHPASRFAMVGVFVSQGAGGVRVAVTGAGAGGVFRATDMEKALSADFSAAALDGIAIAEKNMLSDIHAAADYRAHLVSVMAKRAVEAAG
ncbi:MAG: xanthine dehydrogenase family protein subunit M [Rhodospirillales bacterium]|nr:xanthine dehydrogenase family protein subunit M [Rhodospirillales bacterium]